MAWLPEIRVFPRRQSLLEAAKEFTTIAGEAISKSGTFRVALSGGSTPKALYELLASEYRSRLPWAKVLFFWGDERHVPPDHPDSNYRMANEALLSRIPIKAENVFRVNSENPVAQAAATQYEGILKSVFHLEDSALPRFDLILLGMGPDGHTASLFPKSPALQERSRLVVANWVEKFKTFRITFTFPVLNNAAAVLFLVSGREKAEAAASVLDPTSDPNQFPAKMVQPANGRLMWILDEEAARNLTIH